MYNNLQLVSCYKQAGLLFCLIFVIFLSSSFSYSQENNQWIKKADSWFLELSDKNNSNLKSNLLTNKEVISVEAKFSLAGTSNLGGEAYPVIQEVRSDENSTLSEQSLNYIQNDPGKPIIPVRWFKLLIPKGYDEASISVETLGRTKIQGNFKLPAAQEPVALSRSEQAKLTQPDIQIYSSSDIYPSLPLTDVKKYTWHEHQILSLSVSPIEYIPAQGEVYYYDTVRVSLTTTPSKDNQTYLTAASLRKTHLKERKKVEQFVDNPASSLSYTLSEVNNTTASVQNANLRTSTSCEYLIVTSSALESSFQPLLEHKQSRGLSACIFNLEDDIYPYYSGTESYDNADKLRQFISYAYSNYNTTWVLLGGDIDQVPYRGVYASSGTDTETALPSDEYFGCLDGPWNYDGDSYWGETNDGTGGGEIDVLAEVLVGRAPVSNSTEVANFIAKVISYQSGTHPNLDKAILLGETLDSSTQGSYSSIAIKARSFDTRWNVTERYDENGAWSGSTFLTDLNSSPHIIHHLGHANYTYNSRLSNASLSSLSNTNPYFMYSQGCLSGGFDMSDKSIAEEHVVNEHGAFSVIMNARYGWYYPGTIPGASHDFALQFFDAVSNESKISLGEANRDSKADNLWGGFSGVYRWIFFELNLLGDPEIELGMFSVPSSDGVISGRVIYDSNGDGAVGVDEEGVSGETVFLDVNSNQNIDTGSVVYNASSLPQTIGSLSTVNSTINVSDALGKITDINVQLDITFPYAVAIRAVLYSPEGKRVTLVENSQSWDSNFTNTIFDDEASTSITTGSAPFSGSYKPDSALSLMDGEFANGAWRLEVENIASGYTGTLNSWSITFSYQEPSATSSSDGSFSIDGLKDGVYPVRYQTNDGLRSINPISSYQDVTVTSGVASPSSVNFLIIDDYDSDGVMSEDDCAPLDGTKWRDEVYIDLDDDGIADSTELVRVECFGTTIPDHATSNNNGPDNCPSISNQDQSDADSDGLGDACDDFYDEPPSPRDDEPEENNIIGVWNGFNQHTNVVECANSSSTPLSVNFSVSDYQGEVLGDRILYLGAHGSAHVVLNEYNITDNYGTYEISSTSDLTLKCETLFYKLSPSGSEKELDYAYSIEAGLSVNGESFGIYNSMNPQVSSSQAVYNWLSIYNPTSYSFSGQISVYTSDGLYDLNRSRRINGLAAGQRIDIALGHEDGQRTGLYKIIPDDSGQNYAAFLTRYSPSSVSGRYNFAFALPAMPSYSDSGTLVASTMGNAINWGEIANTSNEATTVEISVYTRDADLLFSEQRTLSPLSQYHIYLNQYLGSENVGYFRVQTSGGSSGSDNIIVESLFYGQDIWTPNQINWAYGAQSQGASSSDSEEIRTININTYFSASSWLKLFSNSTSTELVEIRLYDASGQEVSTPFTWTYLNGSADLAIHEQTGSSFVGSLSIISSSKVSSETVRVYPFLSSSGRSAYEIGEMARVK